MFRIDVVRDLYLSYASEQKAHSAAGKPSHALDFSLYEHCLTRHSGPRRLVRHVGLALMDKGEAQQEHRHQLQQSPKETGSTSPFRHQNEHGEKTDADRRSPHCAGSGNKGKDQHLPEKKRRKAGTGHSYKNAPAHSAPALSSVFFLDAAYLRTHGRKLFRKVLIAPVYMVDTLDASLAFCGKTGENQRRTGTQV